MTLITFQDGKPVMRDGKVGTGQGCCCGGAGPTCCVDGVCDSTKATAEQCAAAGGQWHPDKTCNDLCWCCSYRYICYELIATTKFGGPWYKFPEDGVPTYLNDIDDIPTEQPPGTLFVWAPNNMAHGYTYGCAGTAGIKMYGRGTGDHTDVTPCEASDFHRGILQEYFRARIVDSCDECSGVEKEWEYPDGRVFCCDAEFNYYPDVTSCEDCPGNGNPGSAGCWISKGELLSARAGMSCSPLAQPSCANQLPNGDTNASPPVPLIPWSSCLEAAGISICANPFP